MKPEPPIIADMKERERSIGFLFNDISRMRVTLYDRAVAPLGLTFTQAMALNHLLVSDGLSQIEIARRMDLGAVTISGIVDRLEAGGWALRKPDPRDRRAKTVWITDKALSVKTDLIRALRALNDLTLDGLAPDEVETLARLLRRAKANLHRAQIGDGAG